MPNKRTIELDAKEAACVIDFLTFGLLFSTHQSTRKVEQRIIDNYSPQEASAVLKKICDALAPPTEDPNV